MFRWYLSFVFLLYKLTNQVVSYTNNKPSANNTHKKLRVIVSRREGPWAVVREAWAMGNLGVSLIMVLSCVGVGAGAPG